MPRTDLVTLDEAKAHLGITSEMQNALVAGQLDAAIAIVFDYLQRRDTTWNASMEAWDASTVPLSIKQAILIQCGELYRDRGDDAQQRAAVDPDQLSPVVMALLKRYRDPALA